MSLPGVPLGQVYAGRFRRSVALWCVGGFLVPIFAFASNSLPLGRSYFVLLVLFALAFPIYLAVDAFLLARRNRDAPLQTYQRWWIYVLLFGVFFSANNAVSQVVRSFIAESFVVPTRAMSPTIQAGDRMLVDRLWSRAKRLQRNDVVVFRSVGPDSPLFVMRVVGLPGDVIEIKNERVLIDGADWDDDNAVFDGPLPSHVDLANYGPVTIPDDSFFVLGDNRRLARDSRLLGPIPLADFYGKARMIYWSQAREFPNPHDTSHYTLGSVRWDRMGTRLD